MGTVTGGLDLNNILSYSHEKCIVLSYDSKGGKLYNPLAAAANDLKNSVRNFEWPKSNLNLKQPIKLRLNNRITLSGGSLDKMQLTFNANNKILKFDLHNSRSKNGLPQKRPKTGSMQAAPELNFSLAE